MTPDKINSLCIMAVSFSGAFCVSIIYKEIGYIFKHLRTIYEGLISIEKRLEVMNKKEEKGI